MRVIITLCLFINSLISLGQTIKFKVDGIVKNTKHAKFAYLTTLSQQIPISSNKIFMVTPINNGKFSFKGMFNLEGKDYQYACDIIDERGNITKEELTSKFKQLIWVTGIEKNIRLIILENLSLDVLESDQTISSKILSGGFLTNHRDKLGTAIKERNKKVLEFVKTYPDSPISFDEVEELASFINPSNKEKI